MVALYPGDLEGIFNNILLVGRILGPDSYDSAQKLVAEMRFRIQAVVERVKDSPPLRAYFEVWPLMAAGNGSWHHQIMELVGGINIFGDKPKWAKISSEEVIARDPQAILLPKEHGELESWAAEISNRTGWEAISAVKNKRICEIHPEDIISRPELRIVEAVEQVARCLHPERFS